MSPEVASLRRADEHQGCLLIEVDRKGPSDGQSDAIEPVQTFPHVAGHTSYYYYL